MRAAETAGEIYDIGYRRYAGRRLGRAYAFRTLYVHSLRSAFGIGRGPRALVLPWALLLFACFPAAVTVMAAALTGGMAQLLGYAQYFAFVSAVVTLFCAAQAPELVSTDRLHGVLPLYFARSLERSDYALAKLLAMASAIYLLVLAPLLVLLLGRLSMATSLRDLLRAEAPNLFPILATPAVAAAVLGTLALALASLSARRGIGAALVLGTILVSGALSSMLLTALPHATGRWAVLLNPVLASNGAILALFETEPAANNLLARAGLPPAAFGAAVAAYATVFTAVLVLRYARGRA
jgi:ABC-2 type transport system permease protein